MRFERSSHVYLALSTHDGVTGQMKTHIKKYIVLNSNLSDTLLNVFLAIAVDNLANAQELTKVKQFLCLM